MQISPPPPSFPLPPLYYIIEIGSSITKEKFPLFFDYIDRMKQNEAVKQSYLPPEAHAAFIKGMVNNDGYQDYSTVDIHGTGVTIYTKKE